MSTLITPDLRNAFVAYRLAENEFNRPDENSVTLCSCNKMRNSTEQFLQAYLRHYDLPFSLEQNFEQLLELCQQADDRFKDLDLSCFICSHEKREERNGKFCFSVVHMKDCFTQTKKVKNIVLGTLGISEKDFEGIGK